VRRLPAFVAADADTQQDTTVAAWLHDVIEDTPITVEDLLNSGVRERAVDAVVALTAPKTSRSMTITRPSPRSRWHC